MAPEALSGKSHVSISFTIVIFCRRLLPILQWQSSGYLVPGYNLVRFSLRQSTFLGQLYYCPASENQNRPGTFPRNVCSVEKVFPITQNFRPQISDPLIELIQGILKKDPGLRLMLPEIKVNFGIGSFLHNRSLVESVGNPKRPESNAIRRGELSLGYCDGRGHIEQCPRNSSSGHFDSCQSNGTSQKIRQPISNQLNIRYKCSTSTQVLFCSRPNLHTIVLRYRNDRRQWNAQPEVSSWFWQLGTLRFLDLTGHRAARVTTF